MTELKTKVNNASVTKFLDNISDDAKRTDSYTIVEMLRTATKTEPKMWGGQHRRFRRLPLRGQEWSRRRLAPRGYVAAQTNSDPVHARRVATQCRVAGETGQALARQGLFIHQAVGRCEYAGTEKIDC